MGCDIHLIAEVRHRYSGGSYWKRVVPPVNARCPWCVKQWAERPFDAENAVQAITCWYCDRSYDVFAMIANVRNGYGFAGCDTGDGFVPISEPRGYPDDLSDEAKHWAHMYDHEHGACLERGPGDHSESWVTLAELQAYDWNKTTKKRGCILLGAFADRMAQNEHGSPKEWCGWVSGQGISVIDETEARSRIGGVGIAEREGDKVYVQVSWPITYREAAHDFYTRVIPGLASLGAASEDVRLVFSFDS